MVYISLRGIEDFESLDLGIRLKSSWSRELAAGNSLEDLASSELAQRKENKNYKSWKKSHHLAAITKRRIWTWRRL